MALVDVPAGELATVVTSLEMRQRPKPRPIPNAPLRLVRWKEPRPAAYRTLFRRVGTPWLWFSRLLLNDPELTEIIADPSVEISAATDPRGVEVGLLELDFRTPAACEIAFFGLVPELAGRGHGSWLMAHALASAWRPGVERVWVHTCTLDHPRAFGFYRKHGFTPYAQAVETFADPRLLGVLPREAAPQIPLYDRSS